MSDSQRRNFGSAAYLNQVNWERDSTLRSETGANLPRPIRPVLLGLHSPDTALLAQPIALRDGTWSIGRTGGESAVAIKDSRVSRAHARLTVSRQGALLVLEDTSANGTFVDGERIARHILLDGQVIRVGDSMLLVRYPLAEPRNASIEGLAGAAPSVCALRYDITRMAPEDATVLILGESGTGKELVAQSIHRLSGKKGDFVAVNCAAITESVAESLLFGHVAGAFTGARGDHDGYFRAAHGGTLFLDEIGDLPESIQPKLLRALESGSVLPVGASMPVPCRVRLLAATHRDLAAEVEAGRFRGDLYARLSQLTLRPPALREHREDILPLLRGGLGSTFDELPADVVEALLVDPWPYNVRQLLSVQKRMRVLGAREGTAELARFAPKPSQPSPATRASAPSISPVVEEDVHERDVPPTRGEVLEAVERCKGNIVRTAAVLGRSRKQIYRYLEHYGIDLGALRQS